MVNVNPGSGVIRYGTFSINVLVVVVVNDPSLIYFVNLIISRLVIRTHSHRFIIQFIIRMLVHNFLVTIKFEI